MVGAEEINVGELADRRNVRTWILRDTLGKEHMAGRTGDTFKKRQKEVARAEKAKEKLARRLERKLRKGDPDRPDDDLSSIDSDGNVSENINQSSESGAP